MTIRAVVDAADPALSEYVSLTDVALRRRLEPAGGIFMAESEKVIRRAVDAGYRPLSVLTSERWLPAILEIMDRVGNSETATDPADDVVVLVADDALIQQVTGYRVHRGALSAMHRRALPSVGELVSTARRLVVLEGIVDHTNVGAVFRSVAAFGFDAVVVDPTCADPLYRRSVRVSMGAVLTLPWTRSTAWPNSLRLMKEAGFTTIALTPDATAKPIADIAASPPEKVALLMGAEGHGLSPAALTTADMAVRIPMAAGVDSLNIAAAAAVACFALGPRQ